MYIAWYSECYLCQAPLNPVIRTKDANNKKFVRYYRKIRPLFLYNNEKFMSFVHGAKVKRVCFSCFKYKPKLTLHSIKDRELGLCYNVLPKSKAKTCTEIMSWYEGLIREAYKRRLRIYK
jgi:hypothetical protein